MKHRWHEAPDLAAQGGTERAWATEKVSYEIYLQGDGRFALSRLQETPGVESEDSLGTYKTLEEAKKAAKEGKRARSRLTTSGGKNPAAKGRDDKGILRRAMRGT
jgi:hypothetical protein